MKWTLVQCFQLEPNFGSGKPLRHARMHGTGGPWACWESISPTALPRVQAAGKGFKDSSKNTLRSLLDIRRATLKKKRCQRNRILSRTPHAAVPGSCRCGSFYFKVYFGVVLRQMVSSRENLERAPV